jgi:hypothetical protein
MTINFSFEKFKKVGAVALILTNLFATGVAVSYVRWRYKADPVFALVEWDVNDRLPEMRQRYLQRQAEEAAHAASNATSTPSTTLPPKR